MGQGEGGTARMTQITHLHPLVPTAQCKHSTIGTAQVVSLVQLHIVLYVMYKLFVSSLL